jgi:pimeloyl-ACP methyl ester carboxylesterase
MSKSMEASWQSRLRAKDLYLLICSIGMGDSLDSYTPITSKMVAAGYRVAWFDLRGHGDSTVGFKHCGDEPTANDFLAIINALGAERDILVGTSLSAGASVIAAGKASGKIAGLILSALFLRNGSSKFMLWIPNLALLWPWGLYVWKSYASTLWPGLGKKAPERAVSTAMLTRPKRWAAFQATVAGADHDVVTPWPRKVNVPAPVVIADADPDWSDPWAEAKWVAFNFEDSETITVPGAGHAPMCEKPGVVFPEGIRFLRRINPK